MTPLVEHLTYFTEKTKEPITVVATILRRAFGDQVFLGSVDYKTLNGDELVSASKEPFKNHQHAKQLEYVCGSAPDDSEKLLHPILFQNP